MSASHLTYEELAEVIGTCAGVHVDAVTLSTEQPTFELLQVDSLGVLGIIAELERRLGTALGPEAEQCESPGELLELVNSRNLRQGSVA